MRNRWGIRALGVKGYQGNVAITRGVIGPDRASLGGRPARSRRTNGTRSVPALGCPSQRTAISRFGYSG
jgi:hypothetical protein